jgi:endonuclease YncB( thermonuclease family)
VDAGRDAGGVGLDGGGGRDAQRDRGPEPSPCPLPITPTPTDVPPGYLPPVAVALIRVVDGDTAHFRFGADDRTVRFLYVNTEESHGEETTAFGTATEGRVRDEIGAAGEIVVAVREEWEAPGEPDLDPYDRWLSLVFVDGTLFQTHLVREGLSAYYTRFGCAPEPVHTSLLHAEAEARAARRGIWAAGHPTDYADVLDSWIGDTDCRPNPFREPYCP